MFAKYGGEHEGHIHKNEMCMYIRAKAGVPEDNCTHYDKENKDEEPPKADEGPAEEAPVDVAPVEE